MEELIKAVRKHAESNYETGGWDYVVECFSDKEIAEDIKGCSTPEEAINKMEGILKEMDDYRREIQATVW